MGIRMLVEAICKEKGITQTQVMKSGEPKIGIKTFLKK